MKLKVTEIKKLSVEKYLNKFMPYLKGTINNLMLMFQNMVMFQNKT